MEHAIRIGSSQLRLGNDQSPFTESNLKIYDGITDSGLFNLTELPSGSILTLRRYGPNPYDPNNNRYSLSEIRAYETPNLTQLFSVSITSDTSQHSDPSSTKTFEAENLIQNFEKRGCKSSRNAL